MIANHFGYFFQKKFRQYFYSGYNAAENEREIFYF